MINSESNLQRIELGDVYRAFFNSSFCKKTDRTMKPPEEHSDSEKFVQQGMDDCYIPSFYRN